jgi:hypothetical protein
MRNIVGWCGATMIGVVFIGGFLAYLVSSFDPQTKIFADGLGRPLSESPVLMRLIFGQERLWAGWSWFLADMVIFWSAIGAGIKLAGWGFKEPTHQP